MPVTAGTSSSRVPLAVSSCRNIGTLPSLSLPNKLTGQRYLVSGFTMLEVTLAMVILAICLLPALESLRASLTLLGQQEESLSQDNYALLAKAEEILAQPFADLASAATAAGSPTTPTSFSDVLTTGDGRQLSREVYLWPLDGDNADLDNDPFTGTDSGILYLKVALANSPLVYETIATK